MKIHSYYSSSGKDVILEYIDSLTVDEQVDGYSVLECLEKGELHACRKQKNKTEKQDSKIVIKRAKQLEKELKTNKKFI